MPDSFDFRDAKLAGVRLYETLARVSSCTTAAWIFERRVIRSDCMPSPSRSEELLLMEAQQTPHFSSPFVLSWPLRIPDGIWSLNNGRDLNAWGLQPGPARIKARL